MKYIMNYVQIQYEMGTSVIEMDFFSASMTRGQEREQEKINNFAAFALGIVNGLETCSARRFL